MRQFPFGVGATDEEQRKVELQRPSQGADVPLFLPSLLGQGIAVKSGFIDELVLVFPPASDSHSETTFRWRQMFRLLGVSPNTTGTAIATQFPHLVGFKRSLCLYFLYPLPHPLTTVTLRFNRFSGAHLNVAALSQSAKKRPLRNPTLRGLHVPSFDDPSPSSWCSPVRSGTDATESKVKELAAFIEDRGSKDRAFREHDSVPAKLMAEVLTSKIDAVRQ